MDITPLVPEGKQVIHRYGNHSFTVSGASYDGNIIIFPNRVISWDVDDSNGFISKHFVPFTSTNEDIEILLVGTGVTMQLIPPALRSELKEHNIAVDSMDTGAACRTYNVLLAEERRVAVALLSVE